MEQGFWESEQQFLRILTFVNPSWNPQLSQEELKNILPLNRELQDSEDFFSRRTKLKTMPCACIENQAFNCYLC